METTGRRIYSVRELTARIRDLLEGEFPHVWVAGEVSNFTRAASGHLYFSLKDDSAQLPCVMWRTQARYLRFNPENGLAVVCRGRISVYEPRGAYQLIAEMMEPRGIGALQLAFEQLKKKLAAEGLFDAARKRPLPAFPERIGIVTSPTGAAVRDILRVITARWDNPRILILPALVQGEGAAQEIAAMIRTANVHRLCDVLIVGRGGGSIEDLWAFNEEVVARAIFESEIPVVSAVGHEIDLTIADLVADVRAPTPSVAGELVIPKKSEVRRRILDLREELTLEIGGLLRRRGREVEALAARLRDPRSRLESRMMRVDDLSLRLQAALRHRRAFARERLVSALGRLQAFSPASRVREAQGQVRALAGRAGRAVRRLVGEKRLLGQAREEKLRALSPLAVLARGYAVVRDEKTGKTVRDAAATRPGDALRIRLAAGELSAEVRGVRKSK